MSATTTPLSGIPGAGSSRIGEGWHGVPHICRVRHLHISLSPIFFMLGKSLSGRLHGKCWKRHLLHSLSACPAFDRPLCGKASGTRQARRIPALMVLTIVLGALFLYGTGQEWHRLIYEHG